MSEKDEDKYGDSPRIFADYLQEKENEKERVNVNFTLLDYIAMLIALLKTIFWPIFVVYGVLLFTVFLLYFI